MTKHVFKLRFLTQNLKYIKNVVFLLFNNNKKKNEEKIKPIIKQ